MYIINDIDDARASALERFPLTLLCARTMSQELISKIQGANFDSTTSLLMFPGNGGDIIRSYLPANWLSEWHWCRIHAKRVWNPGSPPQAFVNQACDNRFLLGLTDVIVIDDVISSGETARLIKERHQPWIPGAHWHCATWIQQRAANLPGFSSTLPVHIVGERNRKVPTNSLSTFLSIPEIAENYAGRNLDGQATEFLECIASLRNIQR